jgi:lysophospholipase L1-like esterase
MAAGRQRDLAQWLIDFAYACSTLPNHSRGVFSKKPLLNTMNLKKSWFLLLALCSFLSSCPSFGQGLSSTTISLANKKVLWLGDSITQLGYFVTDVQYYLDKQYPNDKFNIISIGLASETASGLSEKAHPFPRPDVLERLQRALDIVKPDIVVACYGMNDGIYHPQSPDRMQAFQKGINTLVSACKTAGAQVILLTPPPFDKVAVKNLASRNAPDFSYMAPYENYDSVLADYSAWEMTLSPDDAFAIDLHTPINDYLTKIRETDPHFSFTTDGIHPNGPGQLLMAEIILKGLGVPISFDDDLNAEYAKMVKDPLYALVKTQRENRSDGWLPYVGYTRDGKFKTDSIDKVEQTNADLQAQIDKLRTH